MLTKRIIPCLDVKDGKVVKGINFANLRNAGDPVALARLYGNEGADELVFLDITASLEKRTAMVDIMRNVSKNLFIPFTAGGGVRSIADMRRLLDAGAEKVSINSAAVKKPRIIERAAEKFGSQAVVVAIDAKKCNRRWEVFTRSGTEDTGLDAIAWARQAENLGAGELLLTSMDSDGTTGGYDIKLTRTVATSVGIPVIASGGAGSLKDIADVFLEGGADAALAASIFHYRRYRIQEVKEYLRKRGILVRL
ncbi:MAG: imidazole glycerol phosphate synthase subunit HisF [Candidatus Aenigmarchaeota archaeon]|nr:imidazole glycerol phosphate synthase subunit HisF [Candidatus Aenigmarchaeota archaeon]